MTYTAPYYDNAGHSTEGADTTAWGFYRASSAGVPAFVTPIGDARDATGDQPASTTTAGWAINSNYNGSSEVDFWSTVNNAGGTGYGFTFLQKTGASSDTQLAALYGDGTFVEFDYGLFGAGTVAFIYADAVEGSFGASVGLVCKIYSNNVVAVTIDTSQRTTFNQLIRLTAQTVVSLPAAGSVGRIACVSNALAPVAGAAVAGGGAAKALVWDNGAAWNVFAV